MDYQTMELRLILGFVQPLFGTIILLCFYHWLRGRRVKDPSLIWLSLSLFSWTSSGVIQWLGWGGKNGELIIFYLSPISSVLFTMTAFQLLRVREAIGRRGFEVWKKIVVWTVAVASCCVVLLMALDGGHKSELASVAANIDAVASFIALLSLALGMSYSFYRYGNMPLFWLTWINFLYLIWYQFDLAARVGVPQNNTFLIALNIMNTGFLTVLFIALSLAWGLSSASRLKFKDMKPVDIVVVFLDLRGSTAWTRRMLAKGEGASVLHFKNEFSAWVLDSAAGVMRGSAGYKALDFSPFHKWTGDGFMLVWEAPENSKMVDYANAVTGLACALSGGYKWWVQSLGESWRDVPDSVGVGVDFGSEYRLTSENGSYDYDGLTLSYAAKMQHLARPHGGVVTRANWRLTDDLCVKFTCKGVMRIGGESIDVRATTGVKLPGRAKSSRPSPDSMALN